MGSPAVSCSRMPTQSNSPFGEHQNRGGGVPGRLDDHSDLEENEYSEPEERVTPFYPSRTNPIYPQYADRCPMKTRPLQSGAEDYRKGMGTPPQFPRRAGGNTAPLINRDLKPGRRPKITTERRSKTLGSNEPNNITRTSPRPVRSLPRDQGSQSYSTAAMSQPRHTFNQNPDSPPTRHPPCPPLRQTNYTSTHRYSLDVEFHDLHRSQSEQGSTVPDSVRKHHEWPQTKGHDEHGSYTGHSKPVEVSAEQDWYVGAFSRVEAEHALHLVNREGAFLVRDYSKKTTQEPFVLAIFYDNRVFNIQIRFCTETHKYTLGTRIKTNDMFDSVADIIKFHSIFPIMLIDGRNPSATSNQKQHCVLLYPITANDMKQLLS